MRLKTIWAAGGAVMAVVLQGGCGGGGGEAAPQTIAFADAGPVTKTYGDAPFGNVASGGAGSGTIGYQSRDTAVATVRADGLVTIVGAGSTVIDATKAGDAAYQSARASYTLNVARAPQTVAFDAPGPLNRRTGDAFENLASGGGGTGAVSYASANTAVATVDATSGIVTTLAAGSAVITATKAESANHLQAQASYTLNIRVRQVGTVTAWTDAAGTELRLPGAAIGAQLVRPTPAGCIQPDIAACMVLASTALTGNPIQDPAATLSRAAPYWLSRGEGTGEPLLVGPTGLAVSAYGGAAVAFKNRIWYYDFDLRRVLSSDDGQSWVVRGATPSGAGTGSRVAVFLGKVWAVNGGDQVWSSADGVSWTAATTAPFRSRNNHALAVFNDRLWVIGGAYFDPVPYRTFALNDVWSSSDGLNWVREAESAAFTPRYGHRAKAFNGRLWVVAGEGQRGPGEADSSPVLLGDAWSSADGRSWRAEGTPLSTAPRHGFAMEVLGNRMFVSGGYTSAATHADLWHTDNGQEWTRAADPAMGARTLHTLLVFRQKLWSLGGRDYRSNGEQSPEDRNLNEVWNSVDGLAWSRVDRAAPFTPRSEQRMVEFQGRLWIFGSRNAARPDLQVWSSADGDDWVSSMGASVIPPRQQFSLTVFRNKLWLIGGGTYRAPTSYTERNDVWSSVDGETWVQETAAADFPPHRGRSTFTLNGRLYLVGGSEGASGSDIWSSADGIAWNKDLTNAPFGNQRFHSTVSFAGRVWLFAPRATGGDIWSSADGLTWTLERQGEAVINQFLLAPVEFNSRLWILSGATGSAVSSAYSSADGVNWRSEGPAFGGTSLTDVGLAAFKGRLWGFGTGVSSVPNDVAAGRLWSSPDGATWRLRSQYEIDIP